MATGYSKAPEEVTDMVAQVMEEHHLELAEAKVTIQTLMAYKYDKKGEAEPAMKQRGQMILAKMSITSLQDRARGIPDAKLANGLSHRSH